MRRDVVVVGAGHNGLTAAAYLARAGLSVTVLDRRAVIGGATVTEEVLPGYRASACAFVVGLLRPRIIRDLELTRHGLELFGSPDALATVVHEDGQNLVLWKDLDRTVRALQKSVGPRETEAFLLFGRALQRIGELYDPLADHSPPTLDELAGRFEAAGQRELFERFFTGSIADLVDRYFGSDLLRGFFTFPAMVSLFGGPRSPGSAYILTHHSIGSFEGSFGKWGFVRGGMGGLAAALQASATGAGADIRVGAHVAQILTSNGRATGVCLADGSKIDSRVVLSAAEPTRTLLGMVGADQLPAETVEQLTGFETRGSMARVFVAVEGLPEFVGFPAGDGSVQPEHRGHIFLGPTVDRFERAWQAAQAGTIPDDFTIEARIETALDPDLAPGGRHMIVTGIQQLPVELAGRTWDDARAEFEQRVVDRLIAYAPNLVGKIVGVRSITPLDLERDWALTGGNIYHGAMTPQQLVASRPISGSAPYRTPIAGLYLGGSGTHPGGGVTGAPGRNAAMAVLEDLGMRRADGLPPPPTRRRLIDTVLERGPLRRLAFAAARQPLLRPLADRATRKPDD